MVRVRETPIEKIHGAAAIFAFVSRDLLTLAGYFDVSDRTVRRWAETPQWQTALDVFGYDGDRNFDTQPFRDTERDAGKGFNEAHTIYIEALNSGVPKHKLASLTAKATGLTPRRVRNWARQFQWTDTQKKE